MPQFSRQEKPGFSSIYSPSRMNQIYQESRNPGKFELIRNQALKTQHDWSLHETGLVNANPIYKTDRIDGPTSIRKSVKWLGSPWLLDNWVIVDENNPDIVGSKDVGELSYSNGSNRKHLVIQFDNIGQNEYWNRMYTYTSEIVLVFESVEASFQWSQESVLTGNERIGLNAYAYHEFIEDFENITWNTRPYQRFVIGDTITIGPWDWHILASFSDSTNQGFNHGGEFSFEVENSDMFSISIQFTPLVDTRKGFFGLEIGLSEVGGFQLIDDVTASISKLVDVFLYMDFSKHEAFSPEYLRYTEQKFSIDCPDWYNKNQNVEIPVSSPSNPNAYEST